MGLCQSEHFSCAENKAFSVLVYRSGSKLKLNATTFCHRRALLTWIANMAVQRNGKLWSNWHQEDRELIWYIYCWRKSVFEEGLKLIENKWLKINHKQLALCKEWTGLFEFQKQTSTWRLSLDWLIFSSRSQFWALCQESSFICRLCPGVNSRHIP